MKARAPTQGDLVRVINPHTEIGNFKPGTVAELERFGPDYSYPRLKFSRGDNVCGSFRTDGYGDDETCWEMYGQTQMCAPGELNWSVEPRDPGVNPHELHPTTAPTDR